MANSDDVELVIVDTGEVISDWSSYSFASDWLTPTDAWSFVLAGERAVQELADRLRPGTRIALIINGISQATGYVDQATIKSSRSGGTVLTVMGRDTLAPAVDGCLDPATLFLPGMSVRDVVVTCFSPFGFLKYSTSSIADRNYVTGGTRPTYTVTRTVGVPLKIFKVAADGTISLVPVTEPHTVTETITPGKSDLADLPADQRKPHPGDGTYEFAEKICKRFGLHITVNARGDEILVAPPDWDGPATQGIVHNAYSHGAPYLEAESKRSSIHQPTIIIATGSGGGGDFAKSKLKVAMVNELVGFDERGQLLPEVVNVLGRHKAARLLPTRAELIPFGARFRNSVSRALFLHDDESKTQGQLEAYVRREMARRQKEALTLTISVPGHTQDGSPWAVNTIVDVDDDVLGIHEPMWCLARTFTKDRTSGTKTQVQLIPRFTLDLTGK